jgi:hypothetical protein
LTVDHPNAKALWNNFRNEFASEFDFDAQSNLFDLKGTMTYDRLEGFVAYMNSKRRQLPEL